MRKNLAVGKGVIRHWYGWRSDEGTVSPGETGKGRGEPSQAYDPIYHL